MAHPEVTAEQMQIQDNGIQTAALRNFFFLFAI
jgi:hypothetical protein